MVYLYLDESGDLGFDFFTKRPSRYFTITVMLVKGVDNNRGLIKAVRKTLNRKLGRQKRTELKGAKDSIEIKSYFYRQVEAIPFEIYALTLNKGRVYNNLAQKKDRVYNYIARKVLDSIPFEDASTRVELIIDKSKNKHEISEFNDYITRQLIARIDPRIPLEIYHHTSHENVGLQAVDLFSWGIFRKHEMQDREWFDVFKGKVRYDDVYLR